MSDLQKKRQFALDEDLVDLLIARVPRADREFFKAACARRGLTMTGVILDLMRQFTKGEVDVRAARRPGPAGPGPGSC